MRARVLIIFILASLISVFAAKANESVYMNAWDRANTAYVNGKYGDAIEIYDSILNAGYTSQKLYYNIGNAYFKQGEIANSILNYNRALLLDPSDVDARYNLRIANSYIKDNIEAVPEFFLFKWIKAWRSTLSSDAWAVSSLVFLTITLSLVLVYLLSSRLRLRKAGFYLAIITLIITVFSVVFATAEKQKQLKSEEAIIMISAAPVKSSPDNSSTDIFILHEGTKVKVVSSLGEWREITIADGNKGWILESSIEAIRK